MNSFILGVHLSDVSVDVYMIINVYTLCTVNMSMFEIVSRYVHVCSGLCKCKFKGLHF